MGLVGIQFAVLMVILNIILYSPLLTIIEERKEYILSYLAEASKKLAQAKKLTSQYEEILEIELEISQKYIDSLLESISADLLEKKKTTLANLDTSVKALCAEVETKLSI